MRKILLLVFGCLALLTLAGATTVINGQGTSGDVATYGNVNGVLYVTAGDASDIQTKINSGSGNYTVVIPQGVYQLTSSINLKSGLNLVCSNAVIKGVTAYNISQANNVDDVSVSGCFFDMINDNTTSGLVFTGTSNNLLISNNQFYRGNTSRSIEIQNAIDVIISNNFFKDVDNGIDVLAADGVVVSNNYFEAKVDSTDVGPEYGEGIDLNSGIEATVTGNIVLDFNENGIDSNVDGATIIGNVVRCSNDSRQSVCIELNNRKQMSVVGNTVTNIVDLDIGIRSDGNDNTIVGNTLQGNLSGVVTGGIGIMVNGTNGQISGNTFQTLSDNVVNGGFNVMNYAEDTITKIVQNNGNYSLFIDHNSNYPAIWIDNTGATSKSAMWIWNNGAWTGTSRGSALLSVEMENSASTGNAVSFENDGTGKSLYVGNTGNGVGIQIEQIGNGNALEIKATGGGHGINISKGGIFATNLSGTGNDYVCVDAVGLLYRSDSACS